MSRQSRLESKLNETICELKEAFDNIVKKTFQIGCNYEKGHNGANEDYTLASKYYKLAADKGYAPAQYNLGVYYESRRDLLIKDPNGNHIIGYEVAKNQEYVLDFRDLGEAARLYKLAADRDMPLLNINLVFATKWDGVLRKILKKL